MSDWDKRYLDLARVVAGWSKDPSTRCGAIAVRPDKTVSSTGFNGFPRRVTDDKRLHDRETKLAMIIHAELNCILSAHERLDGCALYVWPMPPCSHCAAAIIQAGIERVVSPPPEARWYASCRIGRNLMWESGLTVEWTE